MRRSFLVLCALLAAMPAAAAELSEKGFRQDMAYYHKTSKAKDLSANDRLYILDRLRQKYKQADFDISDLYAEIDRWYGKKQGGAGEGTAESAARAAGKKPAGGTLRRILVTEGTGHTRLILTAPGTADFKQEAVRDPAGTSPPVIHIYLYRTREKLKPEARSFSVKSGFIRQVQARQISKDPVTTRVSVALRASGAYDLTRFGDEIVLKIGLPEPEAAPVVDGTAPAVEGAAAEGGGSTGAAPTAVASPIVPARESALIETGDLLRIQVTGPLEFSHETMVQSDGRIRMPMAGETEAARKTTAQLEEELTKKLSEIVAGPKVAVTAGKFVSQQIFLTGQVRAPGTYRLDQPLGCYQLIVKSGGFLEEADKSNILIYRLEGDKRVARAFNAEEYLNQADPSKDVPLEPGDIVEVRRVADYAFVIGAVQNPGRYEAKEGTRLMQAVYMAGGFTENARIERVRIVRNQEGGKSSQEIDVQKVLKGRPEDDPLIRAGDMIVVPEKALAKPRAFTGRVLPWMTFVVSLGLVLALLI